MRCAKPPTSTKRSWTSRLPREGAGSFSGHYNAAGSIADWLADGARKFGILRAACVSENAAVAVFDGGYKFFGPVPEDLKAALRKTHLDVRIVKIAGSSWFFADEYGSYQFNM